MALQGNLRDIPLTDLFDLITRNETSGVLRLSYTQKLTYQATVIVRSAQLYFAWICKSTQTGIETCWNGEEALQELLALPDAQFIYEILPQNYQFPAQNVFSSKREILLASVFQAGVAVGQVRSTVYLDASTNQKALEPVSPRPLAATLPTVRPVAPPTPLNLSRPATVNNAPMVKSARPGVSRGWLSSVIAYIKKL